MVGVHLEWGPRAVEVFADWADVVVVVDVLSFSTAVVVAVSRGATVAPCEADRTEAERLGAQLGAQVAVPRLKTSPVRPYSLSPVSLDSLPANSTVVLPSPNGATLTARLVWTNLNVVAGCLRNAAAFADARGDLERRLSECVSGRELIERGYDIDATWAAAINTSQVVPVLRDGKYVSASPLGSAPEPDGGHESGGVDGV